MSNKSAARLRQALRTVEYLHEQAPDLDIHIQVRDPQLAGGSTPALLLEGDALYEHGWSTKPRERVPVELSEDPLAIAAEMVADARELHRRYPKATLLVSTSGPRVDYRLIREVSVEVPTVGLQFSVHESTDKARDLLIPFKRKLLLEEIAAEGETWHAATGRRPFFNYCAHEGNTSADDVSRLRRLFNPRIWEATISVVCERDESIATANARQRELASNFMTMMLGAGYSTRMFDPAGQDDIGGGCGQLWYVQQWIQQHPEHARPTVGRSLPIVHAPRPIRRSHAA
jgi:23S rRNA (adenine2503-C2)-methyltransferase